MTAIGKCRTGRDLTKVMSRGRWLPSSSSRSKLLAITPLAISHQYLLAVSRDSITRGSTRRVDKVKETYRQRGVDFLALIDLVPNGALGVTQLAAKLVEA